jgi:hypothetical protein
LHALATPWLRAHRRSFHHPLSAVRECLFNIFAVTLHTGGRSSGITTCSSVRGRGIYYRGEGGGERDFSAPVQSGPEAHPASCRMDTVSFPETGVCVCVCMLRRVDRYLSTRRSIHTHTHIHTPHVQNMPPSTAACTTEPLYVISVKHS